jgi:two-component system nitrate/nitrite response regulator NarL
VTASGEPIRVLVAEHKAMLREGICRLVQTEDDFVVTGMADDGIAALALARELTPDVLLLELELPKMSGLRVLELLDPATSSVRPLLFAESAGSGTVIEALELGARGVLQHDRSASMLFKSIRVVARGDYWVERSIVGQLARHVRLSAKPFGLTDRQREVLSLVVSGYSNKEIAARCDVSTDTVKHHLTSIFDKTGASTRVELAVFALHHGLAGAESEGGSPRAPAVEKPRVALVTPGARPPRIVSRRSA